MKFKRNLKGKNQNNASQQAPLRLAYTGSSSWLPSVHLLAILKALPSLTPLIHFIKNQVGNYSTDCISAMVPLVVATSGVVMDTLFCPDDHFSTPLTLRHQLPSLSIVDEFKINDVMH